MKIAYEIERLSTNGGIERILTDRVNYMAEVWGWDIYILVLLKETEKPFGTCYKQERADTASCYRTDTADYNNQKNFICHGRFEH